MKRRKILLLESNEVPFRVMDYFVKRHEHSSLASILATSKIYSTVCEDEIELDPWISWPTLHRGVTDARHHILHLGQCLDEANRVYPPLWEILARAGVSVGVFGSLHSSAMPTELTNYPFYVPDFFSSETSVHPASLQPFQKFNLLMTRRSARNVDSGIPLTDSINFLKTYATSGMTSGSIRKIMTQLWNERIHTHLKCRRRSIQPVIGMDIFLYLMRRSFPGFATFYTNHVAAAMHRYWAAAFPDDIPGNLMDGQWKRDFAGEIDSAMVVLDGMLRRVKAFVDSNTDYKLLIASSLGQAPVRAEPTKGFVTITDLPRFMRALAVPDGSWKEKHCMVPCVSVTVDKADADAFETRLLQLSVNDSAMKRCAREEPPLSFDRKGDTSFHLFAYFESYAGPTTARLANRHYEFEELGLGFFQHQDNIACSARHSPEGVLIVYDPLRTSVDDRRTRVSTLEIAPAILDNFGIRVPEYMHRPDPLLFDTAERGTMSEFRVDSVERQKMLARVD